MKKLVKKAAVKKVVKKSGAVKKKAVKKISSKKSASKKIPPKEVGKHVPPILGKEQFEAIEKVVQRLARENQLSLRQIAAGLNAMIYGDPRKMPTH